MPYYSPVEVAKLIRQDLKKSFPNVKFSVKSRKGVMSSSISVSYVNGPICKEVENLLNKYKGGSYDCMQDMYVDDSSKTGPTVEYLFVERDYTENLVQQAADYLKETWKLPQDTVSLRGTDFEDFGDVDNWVRVALLKKLDLTSGKVSNTQFTPLNHFFSYY